MIEGCTCTAATASPRPVAVAAFLEANLDGQHPGAAVDGRKETSETAERYEKVRSINDLQLQDAGGQPPVLLP
jgi:hypothetical protein